jgi:hypothetical protein
MKLLGEHGEEASWKIMELEALCKNEGRRLEAEGREDQARRDSRVSR